MLIVTTDCPDTAEDWEGRSEVPIVPARAPEDLVVECHYCGYRADGPSPARCPKCYGTAWTRFAIPRLPAGPRENHRATRPRSPGPRPGSAHPHGHAHARTRGGWPAGGTA